MAANVMEKQFHYSNHQIFILKTNSGAEKFRTAVSFIDDTND